MSMTQKIIAQCCLHSKVVLTCKTYDIFGSFEITKEIGVVTIPLKFGI